MAGVKSDLPVDVANALADFGEAIEYESEGGVIHAAVNAYVLRGQETPQPSSGIAPEHRRRKLQLVIAKGGTLAKVSDGLDRIRMKYRLADDDTTEFLVTKILVDNPGYWKLEAVA